MIIKYVRESYGDELEFLWKKFPDNAVWRRKDNKNGGEKTLNVSSNNGDVNIELVNA